MADVLQLESRIERVEVYRARALLVRRARAEARASDTLVVRLGGLPLALEDDSIRVDVADGTARVVDLHVEWDIATRDRALRTAAEERLRELVRKRTEVAVARDRAAAKLRVLESLVPATLDTTKLPDDLAFQERHPLPAWFRLADFVRQESDTQRGKIRQLHRQDRDLLDAQNRARDELERESAAEIATLATCRKAARVVLAGVEGPVDLEISYMVAGATWVPEYELRVDENDAELVVRALVAQQTGEDWDRVAFAFSTANLQRSAEMPELESWRIGKAQPAKTSGWRDLPDTLDELFEGYERHAGSLPPPAVPRLPDLPDMPRLEEPQAPPPTQGIPRVDEMLERLETHSAAGESMNGGAFAGEEVLAEEQAELAMADADFAPGEPAERLSKMRPPEPAMGAFDAAIAPPAAAAAPAGVMRSMPERMPNKRRGRRSKADKKAVALRGNERRPDAIHDTGEMSREASVAASRDALSYARLRMQGPDGAVRGQLEATTVREQLREGVAEVAPASASALDRIDDHSVGRLVRGGVPLDVSLPAHAVPVGDSADHFASRYPMEGSATLPSDGQLHALTLTRRRGATRRIYRCVPSVDGNVYLMAEFHNPLDVPLLAGPVRVYRGGDFVVTAPLATTPPAKALSVNLGVEPSIRVARNTHFEESTGGLFGSGTVLRHRIEIELHNKLQHPAHIEVLERVPFSREDNVKIEVTESEPRAEPYDQRDRGLGVHGGYKLSVELAAGEKKTCLLEYQINLPSKRVLAGGNRRD